MKKKFLFPYCSLVLLGLGACKTRGSNAGLRGKNSTEAGSEGQKRAGLFRFAQCESTNSQNGFDTKQIFTLNLVTDKKGNPIKIQGVLSSQTATPGTDFVHGFSTLTGNIADISFDHDTLFLKISNGKEAINADGDLQKGGTLTNLTVGVGESPVAQVSISGKEDVTIANCVIENIALFDSIFK